MGNAASAAAALVQVIMPHNHKALQFYSFSSSEWVSGASPHRGGVITAFVIKATIAVGLKSLE